MVDTLSETVLNKIIRREKDTMVPLFCWPRSPKNKILVEDSVGVVSTWVLAVLCSRRFLSLVGLKQTT